MDTEELIKYVCHGSKAYSYFSTRLRRWFEIAPRFKGFVDSNKNKIRKKIKSYNSEEEYCDLLAELEIACLLLKNIDYDVEYEKYKSSCKGSPDFTITYSKETVFNIEVTRIHENPVTNKYNKVVRDIISRVKKIPSSLIFSIECIDVKKVMSDNNKEPDYSDFINNLENSKEVVIDFIIKTINRDQFRIYGKNDKRYYLPIKDHEKEAELILTQKNSDLIGKFTAYGGNLDIIFYTEEEYRVIGSRIREKLGQMIENEINVLCFCFYNSTFEINDYNTAITSIINKAFIEKDEAFFAKEFISIEDFVNKFKELSYIFILPGYISVNEKRDRNYLWENKLAQKQLPLYIQDYLKTMYV